ncbi:MAG: DUF3592 domain-containing protein [Bryobacteraceae bacterium]
MNRRTSTGWSFLILGLLTAVFGIVILAIRIIALQRWTHVQGEVIVSVVNGPDIEELYRPSITIRWKAGASEYSKKFNDWGSSGSPNSFRAILTRYPKGSPAPILCDPANPSRAFLGAGYTWSFLIAPVAVILGGLAAAILGYLIIPRSTS